MFAFLVVLQLETFSHVFTFLSCCYYFLCLCSLRHEFFLFLLLAELNIFVTLIILRSCVGIRRVYIVSGQLLTSVILVENSVVICETAQSKTHALRVQVFVTSISATLHLLLSTIKQKKKTFLNKETYKYLKIKTLMAAVLKLSLTGACLEM